MTRIVALVIGLALVGCGGPEVEDFENGSPGSVVVDELPAPSYDPLQVRKGMTEADVLAVAGPPEKVYAPPPDKIPAGYGTHYWLYMVPSCGEVYVWWLDGRVGVAHGLARGCTPAN